jgi:hypothetical protein
MTPMKTVIKFVSGSDKFFSTYEGIVDEVDQFTTDEGREMMWITFEGETYKGLYNEWIFKFLCDNEGQHSHIVLWMPPKGKPMLCYDKKLWLDYITESH